MGEHRRDYHAAIIPITSILVTPGANPRTAITDKVVAELAESITARGLIEPIVCRPLDPPGACGETYGLVDGETRLRTCVSLGHSTIMVVAWRMTDAEAEDVRMHANLKRWMLDPPALYRVIVKRWDERDTATLENDTINGIAFRTGLSVARVTQIITIHREVAPDLVADFLRNSPDESTYRELVRMSKIRGHDEQRKEWEREIPLPDLPVHGQRGKRRPSQGDVVKLANLVRSTGKLPLARGDVPVSAVVAEAAADLLMWVAGRNAGAIDLTQRAR